MPIERSFIHIMFVISHLMPDEKMKDMHTIYKDFFYRAPEAKILSWKVLTK